MEAFDESLVRLLAQVRSPVLNQIARDVTSLGSTALIVIQALIAGVLLVVVGRHRKGALQLGLSVGITELTVEILKRLLRRDRPQVVPPLTEVTGYSYPSGHTAAATALYLTLVIIIGPWLHRRGLRAARWISGILVVLVGISRIYLAVHYPTDVASGFLVGAGWSLAMAKIFKRQAPKSERA